MQDQQIVRREDIFNNGCDEQDELENSPILPDIDFQLVEVNSDKVEGEKVEDIENAEQEFEFPLFSFGHSEFGSNEDNAGANNGGNGGDINDRKLIKISLREPEPEQTINERPKSYYVAEYTVEQKNQFKTAALEYGFIIEESLKDMRVSSAYSSKYRGKLLDLSVYNRKIEEEKQREERLKKRRPGKKQRLARKMGKQHEEERAHRASEIKKMIKKRFHKRGGKKNKKKGSAGVEKPKFRTE
ncbi:HFL337Wp [Eremothecium sinecaudum]|uniref:HFL337Wp n=1 Tax=Eremothecium sinecaudum TaxID=45286 RepID=A0A0X8HU73_9SACH|nr:HFL337Wp [Eremothecium sinecaudum]AMD21519.1 HFL337Wp [Eremothecium sinecaudum]